MKVTTHTDGLRRFISRHEPPRHEEHKVPDGRWQMVSFLFVSFVPSWFNQFKPNTHRSGAQLVASPGNKSCGRSSKMALSPSKVIFQMRSKVSLSQLGGLSTPRPCA